MRSNYIAVCSRCGHEGELGHNHTCMADVLSELRTVSGLLRKLLEKSEPAGQGEWIAVSERLPKAKLDDIYSEDVLVMFAGRRTVARRDTSSNEWQETSVYHCATLDEQAVTFWRKLPSPPASEATKETK